MRETNLDLFDPRTGMDYSPNGDFGFAFNDSNFSDRVLRIEIVADPPESCSDGDTCLSLANWDRHRKRRREDVKKDNGLLSILVFLVLRCLCGVGWAALLLNHQSKMKMI